jgi:hypothetical protein
MAVDMVATAVMVVMVAEDEGAKGRQIFQVIQFQDADIEVAVNPPIQNVIPQVPLRQHHVAVH